MTVDEAIFYLKIDREQKIDAMSSAEVAKKTCTIIAYDKGIEALEKQIPKKPVKKNLIVYQKDKDGHERYAYDHHCPMCDRKLIPMEHHCLCGQTISWTPNKLTKE